MRRLIGPSGGWRGCRGGKTGPTLQHGPLLQRLADAGNGKARLRGFWVWATRVVAGAGRCSLLTLLGCSPPDHNRQLLVPARPLSHPRNPRCQPPARRPRRPRLRRPRRLRDERHRRHSCLAVDTEPGTCGQGGKRGTTYAAGSGCLGRGSSGVYEQRLRINAGR